MVAAPEEVKEFVRRRHRGLGDPTSPSTSADGAGDNEAASAKAVVTAPTRARAHHVLVFGRKFYLEDTVKVMLRLLPRLSKHSFSN